MSPAAPREAQPYQSAADLPSFRSMAEQMDMMTAMAPLLPVDQQQTVQSLKEQLHQIVDTVDRFAALLGPRHWIFCDFLPAPEVRAFLDEPAEEAERRFIHMHVEGTLLQDWVRRNVWKPGLRERETLIRSALRDYGEGRYDAAVVLLLSVIDGFVNDANKVVRRGLHARSAAEMRTWDNVVGHHLGLAHVVPLFTREFKKTDTREIYELHRNGIVHGMLPNFGNVIVATKAWNVLAAVVDWAADAEKQKQPQDAEPTWKELITKLRGIDETKKALNAWTKSSVDHEDPGFAQDELQVLAAAFFENWKLKRYGNLTESLQARALKNPDTSSGGYMRSLFADWPLEDYALQSIDYVAPVIAVVQAQLRIAGKEYRSVSRWFYEGSAGEMVLPHSSRGRWTRVFPGPEAFLNNGPSS